MFRALRILILLVILAAVGLSAWRAKVRTTAWNQTLTAVVYPLNGDGSAATGRHINGLTEDDFEEIEDYITQESKGYGINTFRPIDMRLARTVTVLPPPQPTSGEIQDVMLWSLRLRWWAWKHDSWKGIRPDLRLFVLYYDPEKHLSLDHSTGLEKGHIAVIKAFASPQYSRSNQVVITHEMLHTLGASDKYDPGTLQPIYPQGYAEPQATPRLPQRMAEIMGGRIPQSDTSAAIPPSLAFTRIGPATAAEIGLVKPKKKD